MSIPCFQTSDHNIIQTALDEVEPQETGTIINDHYSRFYYINRRVGFLGKLPGYSQRGNGLFDLVRLDADAVFACGDRYRDISVQEVRRREIINEVVPLLPLPTRENMPSEDEYAGLPDSEWAEGKEAAPRTFVASPAPKSITALPSPLPSAGPASPLGDAAEDPVAAGIASQGAKDAGPSAESTRAAGTVASYAGRGVKQPIKYKRGTERPFTGPNETAQSVSSDSEEGGALTDLEDEAAKRKRQRKAPKPTVNVAGNKKGEAPARSAPAPRKKKNNSTGPSIDAIVSGRALPKTKAQAKQADEARYELLVRAHNVAREKQKRRKSLEPELMPEYFQTANFPDGSERESQVRCVCGVVVDDGLYMVCCDECSVWQHDFCVDQEAKPAAMETGRYLCHNCDPWAHRRKIRELRSANVVNV